MDSAFASSALTVVGDRIMLERRGNVEEVVFADVAAEEVFCYIVSGIVSRADELNCCPEGGRCA